MIISQLRGGLGNQMFQYACGRALAEETGQSFKLDISSFANYKLHNGFELNIVFSLGANVATKEDLYEMLGWQKSSLARKALSINKLSWLRKKSYIVEPYFEYWNGLKFISENAYLVGNWQTEKYFQSIKKIIRKEFTFDPSLSIGNEQILNNIRATDSVSLHIRRGDYQTGVNLKIHGLCPLDYYYSAIKYIVDRVNYPHFYIFSDDISWAIENLKPKYPCTFVANNKNLKNYNDMYLMSLCKHNIIANSSFGWWGAWLNLNRDKIVISPNQWFAKKIDTKDLIPPEWIRL